MGLEIENYCGSPFWGYPEEILALDNASTSDNTSYTVPTTQDPNARKPLSQPDVSVCIQYTILVWVPCGFMFLIAPFYFYILKKSTKSKAITRNWLNISKLVVCVLCMVCCIAEIGRLIKLIVDDHVLFPGQLLAPVFRFFSLVLAGLFIELGRRRGLRSSGVMFVFWIMQVVAAVFIFRSLVLHHIAHRPYGDGVIMSVFMALLVGLVIEVILVCLVDRAPPGDDTATDPQSCPEYNCGVLSRLTFWWFTGMVVKGYKKSLVRDDLWHLSPDDQSQTVVPKFEIEWNKELLKSQRHNRENMKKSSEKKAAVKENADGSVPMKKVDGVDDDKYVTYADGKKVYKASFSRALGRTFGGTFLMAAFLKFVHDCLMFVSPQILKALIAFTRNKQIPQYQGYILAVAMFVNALIQSLILHQYFHRCFLVGMRVRTAIIAAVYKKALRLSNAARRTSTVGEIVNLMSVDAQRFMELSTYLNMIWSAPFQMCVSLYFLWMTLGPSVLAGVGVMIILIPINALIAKKAKALQVKQMKEKDARIKLMNEVLNGIKVLKLYAWELSFQDKVLAIRNRELKVLKLAAYLNAGSSFIWTCAPFLVSLTTFAVYVLSSPYNILDAEKAFVSLSLFNILRFPMSMLPMLIATMVQTSVSVKRLRDFLINEELDPENVDHDKNVDGAIRIDHGSFRWDKDEETPTIKDVDLSVKEGALIAVVGQVGTGKTSLLSAILGEMEKIQGRVNIKGSLAYVAQQAWIQNSTLKDNILFNKPEEKCDYNKVLETCALVPDLEMLPAGDMTEIGEKGINLSGGQKQRISLARAVYSNADVYLLDDPLSAVDSHVGKHIFEQVIGPKGVLKSKTRVLVTHGISFLPQVDQVVVMVDGKISEMGSYQELLDQNGAFADFLRNYLTQEDENESEIDIEEVSLREDILSLFPCFSL